MRCFIGLDLAAQDKLAIEAWREKALPRLNAAVPAANFHITLAFLGQIDERQCESLSSKLDTISTPSFNITLNELGYWSEPRILFLGTSGVPKKIHKLAEQCRRAARSCNIPIQQQNYVPHVTLVRKIKDTPPAALLSANFEFHFSHFHLFESISTKTGVTYPIRKSWVTKLTRS